MLNVQHSALQSSGDRQGIQAVQAVQSVTFCQLVKPAAIQVAMYSDRARAGLTPPQGDL